MGKYKIIREIVREVMRDGNAHTAEELHKMCEKRGVEINSNRAEIYNTVHQLKKKGEIISAGENGYQLIGRLERDDSLTEECINFKIEKKECGMDKKVDLSDFEIIRPAIRRENKQVISVFNNGDLALNGALRKILNVNQVEIRIKRDCSQIALLPEGEVLLDITKNNRIKNYKIYEKLEKKKINFPVYYWGEWDEENKMWIGELMLSNPNKNARKIMK